MIAKAKHKLRERKLFEKKKNGEQPEYILHHDALVELHENVKYQYNLNF